MTNQQIIDLIGMPAAVDQVAEESAEFTHASLKLSRALRGKSPTPITREEAWKNLMEEFADVLLMAQIIGLWVDLPGIYRMMDAKRQRMQQRLQEEYGGTDDTRTE